MKLLHSSTARGPFCGSHLSDIHASDLVRGPRIKKISFKIMSALGVVSDFTQQVISNYSVNSTFRALRFCPCPVASGSACCSLAVRCSSDVRAYLNIFMSPKKHGFTCKTWLELKLRYAFTSEGRRVIPCPDLLASSLVRWVLGSLPPLPR